MRWDSSGRLWGLRGHPLSVPWYSLYKKYICIHTICHIRTILRIKNKKKLNNKINKTHIKKQIKQCIYIRYIDIIIKIMHTTYNTQLTYWHQERWSVQLTMQVTPWWHRNTSGSSWTIWEQLHPDKSQLLFRNPSCHLRPRSVRLGEKCPEQRMLSKITGPRYSYVTGSLIFAVTVYAYVKT